MARTENRRNVVVVLARNGTTYHGRGVEVQTDGTLVLGTAKTSTTGWDHLRDQLVQPAAASGGVPEGSALYSEQDVQTVVRVEDYAVA